MNIDFIKSGRGQRILQIDGAHLSFSHFSGDPDERHKEGECDITIKIPDMETADALMNDLNEYGVGWNVSVKESTDPDNPYINFKIKFGKSGGKLPKIYLQTGSVRRLQDPEKYFRLDKMDIESVDMDVRANDGIINGKPYRSAWLNSMCVYQKLDRFSVPEPDEEAMPFA